MGTNHIVRMWNLIITDFSLAISHWPCQSGSGSCRATASAVTLGGRQCQTETGTCWKLVCLTFAGKEVLAGSIFYWFNSLNQCGLRYTRERGKNAVVSWEAQDCSWTGFAVLSLSDWPPWANDTEVGQVSSMWWQWFLSLALCAASVWNCNFMAQ